MNGLSFFGLIMFLGGAVLCGAIEVYCNFFQSCGTVTNFMFFLAFLLAVIGFILLAIGTITERRSENNGDDDL